MYCIIVYTKWNIRYVLYYCIYQVEYQICIALFSIPGGVLDMYCIIVYNTMEYQICIVLLSITGGILDMYCIIVYTRWNIRYVLYYCL